MIVSYTTLRIMKSYRVAQITVLVGTRLIKIVRRKRMESMFQIKMGEMKEEPGEFKTHLPQIRSCLLRAEMDSCFGDVVPPHD
jgi:hypothetical protein